VALVSGLEAQHERRAQVADDADVPFKEFARNVHAACHVLEGLQAQGLQGKAGSLLLPSMLMTPIAGVAPAASEAAERSDDSPALRETVHALIAEVRCRMLLPAPKTSLAKAVPPAQVKSVSLAQGIQTVRKPERADSEHEQVDAIVGEDPPSTGPGDGADDPEARTAGNVGEPRVSATEVDAPALQGNDDAQAKARAALRLLTQQTKLG